MAETASNGDVRTDSRGNGRLSGLTDSLREPDRGERTAYRIHVKGTVQGVGFRPFVFNLARKHALGGWVLNSSSGVKIEIEGSEEETGAFLNELRYNPPRLARIDQLVVERILPPGWKSFEIRQSDSEEGKELVIPPDVALCDDCRRELFDPRDRRYLYPFTNCTNCGPRFTIIEDIPYDRPNTSMRKFAMCEKCSLEYRDPANRRFHAQPNACPVCGPRVTLTDRKGRPVTADDRWIEEFRRLIKDGNIVAIKGLGGFHLACDPRSEKAVQELRFRKKRPARPLAVMCRDVEVAMRYCAVDPEEQKLLESPEAPIVVLRRRRGCPGEGIPAGERELATGIAPKLSTLGVMLPYTPLHSLLFDDEVDILVMTSGNLSELPLARDNEEAFRDLGGIADFFLVHDRDIIRRCDDSLVRVIDGDTHFYRRSRGYVPRPICLKIAPSQRPVLGVGGEMKNVFCLLKGNEAFLSQHIGEMDHREGVENFLETFRDLSRMLEIHPAVVAYDMHPAYHSALVARSIPAELHVPVQHHHAHMASVMAENGLEGPVIGIIADGTGYGTDGRIWGFEILVGGYESFRRLYHLRYVPMPGGERAVRFPWLMALSYLYDSLGEDGMEVARRLFGREKELNLALAMLKKRMNCPLTSGCGRLFDAVSAILGLCHENTYEGQAAVELGELALEDPVEGEFESPDDLESYPFDVVQGSDGEVGIVDPRSLIREIVSDVEKGVEPREISVKFHRSVARMMVAAAKLSARLPGTNETIEEVVLSGGSFLNPLLFRMVREDLEKSGFGVHFHRLVPANDAGIALGQAVIAARRCNGER